MKIKTYIKRIIQTGLVLTAIPGISFAVTQRKPAISLQELTQASDEIIAGKVIRAETRIVGKQFETDYEVQISDSLKSSGGLAAGQSTTLTVPGGVLHSPPVTQYVMSAPYMFRGEDVVLFLKKGSAIGNVGKNVAGKSAPQSKLTSSYQVVGWNQGHFTLVTPVGSQERLVTRINLENYGVTNTPEEMKAVNDAITSRDVNLVRQQIARAKDLAMEVKEKDPLEVTATDGTKLKLEATAQRAEAVKLMRQGKNVSVENYNDFKVAVQTAAQSGN